VVIVFLHDFLGADVELYDFFVRHTGEEFVLDGGVEADYVGYFAGGEAGDAGTSFCVPQFYLPVVGGGEEGFAVVGEGDVGYGFGVAVVGTEELALMINIP